MLWVSICEAARSTDGSAAARLAALLIALRDQPDIVSDTEHAVKNRRWVYWRDLPEWGQPFEEYGFGESRRFSAWLVLWQC
jgi:hypothetical protein